MEQLDLAAIKIGSRVRQRVGELDPLKDSIDKVGLLQPIVVDQDGVLISGWRRLQALKALDQATPGRFKSVPVHIVRTLHDAATRLTAERDENTCREEMNGFEIAEISRRLLVLETPKAQERQRAHGGTAPGRKKKNTQETVSEVSPEQDSGKALEQVASAVHVSAPSLRKGIVVLEAYEGDPKKYAAVKPALESKKWSKAARIVREINDPTEKPRESKPGEQLHEAMNKVHAKLEGLWNEFPRNRDLLIGDLAASLASFRSRRSA